MQAVAYGVNYFPLKKTKILFINIANKFLSTIQLFLNLLWKHIKTDSKNSTTRYA